MGYDYYVIIQGKYGNNPDDWTILTYDFFNGSYDKSVNYYFYNHRYTMPKYDITSSLLNKCGVYSPEYSRFGSWYIFSYDDIKIDYLKYTANGGPSINHKLIREKLTSMVNSNITMDMLTELRNILDKVISDVEINFKGELETYHNICETYRSQYQDVRILYGIFP